MPIVPSNDKGTQRLKRIRRGILPVMTVLSLCVMPLTPVLAAQPPATAQSNLDPSRGLPQAPTAHVQAAFQIVAFGSSSTQGIGATSPLASYPADLERLLTNTFHSRPPVTVINRGVGGEDIDDMMKRLKPDILARKPDLVIWQVGSNDSLRGVPIERFEAELRTGIAAIQTSGAEVVLMEPQWCPAIAAIQGSNRFVDLVRSVGQDERVEVIRRYDLMQHWVADGLVTREQLIGPDNLHMTDQGYAMLAKAVLDEVVTKSTSFRERMAVAVSKQP